MLGDLLCQCCSHHFCIRLRIHSLVLRYLVFILHRCILILVSTLRAASVTLSTILLEIDVYLVAGGFVLAQALYGKSHTDICINLLGKLLHDLGL